VGDVTTKSLGTQEMAPSERYSFEIEWAPHMPSGDTLAVGDCTAVLRALPLRTDVSSFLELPLVVAGTRTTVWVKSGLTRGRAYELEVTVTPRNVSNVAGPTLSRRIKIPCV
jgi:hypothetical protein